MNSPLLSIILINFNGERYLKETLDSLADITDSRVEKILIDGRSADGSMEIIKKYKQQFEKIVSEPDSGQSDALNKGLEFARGIYFTWLNSDDLILAKNISIVLSQLERYKDQAWFACNSLYIDDSSRIISAKCGPTSTGLISKQPNIEVYGPSSIFHRNLALSIGGFRTNLHYCMDTDLWMRFVKAGYVYKRLNIFLWVFRIHYHSKTSHAFREPPNEKFATERILIRTENHWPHQGLLRAILLKADKILQLTPLKSVMYTINLRGRHISTILK